MEDAPAKALKETYSAYPRGMGAPLPGGTPLVKGFGQKRAAAKKSDDATSPPSGGGLSSWMDAAKHMWERSVPRCLGAILIELEKREAASKLRPERSKASRHESSFVYYLYTHAACLLLYIVTMFYGIDYM